MKEVCQQVHNSIGRESVCLAGGTEVRDNAVGKEKGGGVKGIPVTRAFVSDEVRKPCARARPLQLVRFSDGL